MTVIGVVGYGVVGSAVAQGFYEKGFKVLINDPKTATSYTYSKKHMIENCDVVFICVGTPPSSSGAMEDGYLLHALNEFADLDEAKPRDKLPIFVIKSTVLPGTTVKLEKSYPRFKFAVNPEFLREQSASKDFLNPDRVVIGASDLQVSADIREIYISWDCAKIYTTPLKAELIKYLSNAYFVMKVAFACEMHRICKHYDVKDTFMVSMGVKGDHRIHPSHLNPTLGKIPFSSPCLPKDLLALIKALEADGVDTSFLQAIFDGGVER